MLCFLTAPQFHHKYLGHVTLQSRATQHPHQNHLYDSTDYGIFSVSLLSGSTIRKQKTSAMHYNVPERELHCLLSKKHKVTTSYFKHTKQYRNKSKVPCNIILRIPINGWWVVQALFHWKLCSSSCMIKQFSEKGTNNRNIFSFNFQMPNINYSSCTAPLTSKVAFYIFIQQI